MQDETMKLCYTVKDFPMQHVQKPHCVC